MCQNKTDSQKPLSGACAKVQGHGTAQLQLSNQSPTMRHRGISAIPELQPSLREISRARETRAMPARRLYRDKLRAGGKAMRRTNVGPAATLALSLIHISEPT